MSDFSLRDEEGEWEAANTAFERATQKEPCRSSEGHDVVSTLIRYGEAAGELHKKAETSNTMRSKEVHESNGFRALLCCFHKKYSKLSVEDRQKVIGMSKTELDPREESHCRLMGSIYVTLLELPPSAPFPLMQGRHWESIGFQGDNPSTDLRSTGMLGPLQILCLFEKAVALTERARKMCFQGAYEFPFVLVAFNLSALAMDLIDCQCVISASNRLEKEGSSFPVLDALNTLYLGAWEIFLAFWEEEPRRSISDFGHVKQRVRKTMQNSPSSVMKLGLRATHSKVENKSRPAPADQGFSTI